MESDIQLRSRFPRLGVSGYGSQNVGTSQSASRDVWDVFGKHTEAKRLNLHKPIYKNGPVKVIRPADGVATLPGTVITRNEKTVITKTGRYHKVTIHHKASPIAGKQVVTLLDKMKRI